MVQTKLFLYEPDLLANVASFLLHPNSVYFSDYQDLGFSAISALDALAHLKNKLTESMSLLNIGANHGMFMNLFRNIVLSFEKEGIGSLILDTEYQQDYIDAFLSFLSFLLNTQSGGAMLTGAGLVPILLSALEVKSRKHLKVF